MHLVGYSSTQKHYKCVTIPLLGNFLFLSMWPLLKERIILPVLIFRRRHHSLKIRTKIHSYLTCPPFHNLPHPSPWSVPITLLFCPLSKHPLLISCYWPRKLQLTILLDHYRYTQREKNLLLNLCKYKSWNQSLKMRSMLYQNLLLIILVLLLIIMILINPLLLRKVHEIVLNTIYTFVSCDRLSHSYRAFLTRLNTVTIPKTLPKALNNKKWRQAMSVEIEALEKNKTWE